jgi:hypothetical protein
MNAIQGMTPRLKGRWLWLATAALIACANQSAGGTTLQQMTIETMTQKAQRVVRAHCMANSIVWNQGEIWTVTTFAVEETWKGQTASETSGTMGLIRVRLLGGRLGNLTSTVAEVPRFRAGEDVVLFLEPISNGDFSVTSWAQGTFRLRRDARTGQERATQDTASAETFNAGTRRFGAMGERDISLTGLRARVLAAETAEAGGAR